MTEVRRQFHQELDDVADEVAQLGALAREAIQAGTEAFLNNDLQATEAIIANDSALDNLAHSIETRVPLLLALQQPVAADLRLLVAVLRISHDLERIGDNMVNVTKATRRLYPHPLDPRMRGLVQRMREQATAQLNVALTSFVDRDPSTAAALRDMDDTMDQLQKEMFRVIFETQSVDDATIQTAVQISLVGRYFERIADLSVSIGERVGYMVTGVFPFEPDEDPD